MGLCIERMDAKAPSMLSGHAGGKGKLLCTAAFLLAAAKDIRICLRIKGSSQQRLQLPYKYLLYDLGASNARKLALYRKAGLCQL